MPCLLSIEEIFISFNTNGKKLYLFSFWCLLPQYERREWNSRNNSIVTKKACCAVTQPYPTLCNPTDYSMPGFLVLHYPPELVQTHVHQVDDAIQSSCPLSSPSPPAFNLSQNQGLFQRFSSLHQVAKVLQLQLTASVLPMNIQDRFPLGVISLISVPSKGLSRVFSSTTVKKHEFIQHSAFFLVHLSHPYMTTGKTIVLTRQTFTGKVMSLPFLKCCFRLSYLCFQGASVFNSVAVVTVHSDFGAKKIKSATVSNFSHLFAMK